MPGRAFQRVQQRVGQAVRHLALQLDGVQRVAVDADHERAVPQPAQHGAVRRPARAVAEGAGR